MEEVTGELVEEELAEDFDLGVGLEFEAVLVISGEAIVVTGVVEEVEDDKEEAFEGTDEDEVTDEEGVEEGREEKVEGAVDGLADLDLELLVFVLAPSMTTGGDSIEGEEVEVGTEDLKELELCFSEGLESVGG